MTNYRRNRARGATYFFTVNLEDRRLRLLTDHIEQLRAAFRYARERHPFMIDAIVVLPEHLHTIWTLPDGDVDYPTRWRLIKSTFSRALPAGERFRQAGHKGASAASGSAATGSTRYETIGISRDTSTMFTTIRSSMDTYHK